MAQKQSRRSVSVRRGTYERLQDIGAARYISISDFVEQAVADRCLALGLEPPPLAKPGVPKPAPKIAAKRDAAAGADAALRQQLAFALRERDEAVALAGRARGHLEEVKGQRDEWKAQTEKVRQERDEAREDAASLRRELGGNDLDRAHVLLSAIGIGAGEIAERVEDLIDSHDEFVETIRALAGAGRGGTGNESAEDAVERVVRERDEAVARAERAKAQSAMSPTRSGIYVASKSKHAPMWKRFREAGAPIISTWLDEAGWGETASWRDSWERFVREAASARAVVFYGEAGEEQKGALVEIGAALGAGAVVFLVGVAPGSWTSHPSVFTRDSVEVAIGEACALARSATADRGTQIAHRAGDVVVAVHQSEARAMGPAALDALAEAGARYMDANPVPVQPPPREPIARTAAPCEQPAARSARPAAPVRAPVAKVPSAPPRSPTFVIPPREVRPLDIRDGGDAQPEPPRMPSPAAPPPRAPAAPMCASVASEPAAPIVAPEVAIAPVPVRPPESMRSARDAAPSLVASVMKPRPESEVIDDATRASRASARKWMF